MQSVPLRIHLSNHVTLAVPPRLDSITTYVLLEQETWFEKELSFLSRWLKPGMTAIDIGANLGVYALPIAQLVGPHGCVFAYEPGSEARGLLELSRDINIASNLYIFDLALSDSERNGRLLVGASSELNALGDAGGGQPVHITSLDIENRKRGWLPPDFVKIDAEGEEERILAGGRDFFVRHSPLIMFEIKADEAKEAPDHLNADIWRSGMVPGTCVIRNSRQSRRSNKLETHRETISRNALCPCGSGQKYKHCCGAYVS